jgi:hypothetical protein
MFYNILDDSKYIIIIHNGETFTINNDDPSIYEKVKAHCLNQEFSDVEKYLWVNMFNDIDDLYIDKGNIYYKKIKLPSSFSDILFDKRKQNENIEEYLKFYNSLEYNEDFKNNKIKRVKFYKNLNSVYPLGDIALYDSSEDVNIKNIKQLNKFNPRFVIELKKNKDVEKTLESIAGFKSKNLIKLFKNEIRNSNNVLFVDFLILCRGIFEPNLLYKLWDELSSNFSLKDPFFLNQFLRLNKRSDIGVYNYIKDNSQDDLSRLEDLLKRYSEVMVSVELEPANLLRESLIRLYNRKTGKLFELNQERYFPEIESMINVVGKYQIVYPKDNQELVEWSQIMRNCISTYSQSAKNGKCLLLGIRENNELKYTIEITTERKIRQFVTKGNASVSKDIVSFISKHLQEQSVVKK